ncbi:hypothetical protein BC629DRAFT_1566995, partial [Irpex lacteus]
MLSGESVTLLSPAMVVVVIVVVVEVVVVVDGRAGVEADAAGPALDPTNDNLPFLRLRFPPTPSIDTELLIAFLNLPIPILKLFPLPFHSLPHRY